MSNAIKVMQAEIERLRAENEHLKLVDYYNGRRAVIEECAQVAENAEDMTYSDVAAAIRALKEK